MIDKTKTFKGGHAFGNLTGMPKAKIRHTGIPDKVTIPLQQGFGAEVKAIVKNGDKVKAGQMIGIDDDSMSTPVHSTVNGTVANCEAIITDSATITPATGNPKSQPADKGRKAIVIESDGTTEWTTTAEYLKDIDHETPEGVFKSLYISGVSALGVSGIPTLHNTSPISPDKVENIIINCTNSEPFSLPVSAFFKGNEKSFITGLTILNFIFPEADIDLAFDSNNKETYYRLFNSLNSKDDYIHKGTYTTGKLLDKICIRPLKPKFPQGNQAILTETIVGKITGNKDEFEAINSGIIILNARDVFCIYEAIIEGRPLIDKVIALGGYGYNVNHGVKVRIGTSIDSIVTHRHRSGIESRLILNSIMTGRTINNHYGYVNKCTNSIIALPENRTREFQNFMRPGLDRDSFSNTFLSSLFKGFFKRNDTNLNGEYRACIACNYCEYACPVNILPFLISKYVKHDMVEDAEGLNIFDCVECGLCSFVCPSKIPVLKHIQEGKEKIRAYAEEEPDAA